MDPDVMDYEMQGPHPTITRTGAENQTRTDCPYVPWSQTQDLRPFQAVHFQPIQPNNHTFSHPHPNLPNPSQPLSYHNGPYSPPYQTHSQFSGNPFAQAPYNAGYSGNREQMNRGPFGWGANNNQLPFISQMNRYEPPQGNNQGGAGAGNTNTPALPPNGAPATTTTLPTLGRTTSTTDRPSSVGQSTQPAHERRNSMAGISQPSQPFINFHQSYPSNIPLQGLPFYPVHNTDSSPPGIPNSTYIGSTPVHYPHAPNFSLNIPSGPPRQHSPEPANSRARGNSTSRHPRFASLLSRDGQRVGGNFPEDSYAALLSSGDPRRGFIESVASLRPDPTPPSNAQQEADEFQADVRAYMASGRFSSNAVQSQLRQNTGVSGMPLNDFREFVDHRRRERRENGRPTSSTPGQAPNLEEFRARAMAMRNLGSDSERERLRFIENMARRADRADGLPLDGNGYPYRSRHADYPPESALRHYGPRRAKATFLESLPQVEISAIDKEDRWCSICYEEYGKPSPDEPAENPVKVPCGHIFGKTCIRKWFEEHTTCPSCRSELGKGDTVPVSMMRRVRASEERGHFRRPSSLAGLAERAPQTATEFAQWLATTGRYGDPSEFDQRMDLPEANGSDSVTARTIRNRTAPHANRPSPVVRGSRRRSRDGPSLLPARETRGYYPPYQGPQMSSNPFENTIRRATATDYPSSIPGQYPSNLFF